MKKIVESMFILIVGAVALSACSSLNGGSSSALDGEDRIIEARIQQRLESDPVIRSTMVRVDVEYGFATIYGEKPKATVLARIISVVKNTPGVRDVDASF